MREIIQEKLSEKNALSMKKFLERQRKRELERQYQKFLKLMKKKRVEITYQEWLEGLLE